MPAMTATAPGKVILFGEHAVVYGRPAIAAPVNQVQARAVIQAEPRAVAGSVHVQAPDIHLDVMLADLPGDHPISLTVRSVLVEYGLTRSPACTIRVTSTIPIASGLGSGAAVAVALLRAFSAFLGQPLPNERISALAFEVEKIHHGTPSGIDNTVITYAMPVYFVHGPARNTIELISVSVPITLVIGDTGVPSPTAQAVGDLRHAWQSDPKRYEPLFDRMGWITQMARQAIVDGRPELLGDLMNQNQDILSQVGVSSPELDRLVSAARAGGASGAKLSGGGKGGNMIALALPAVATQVARALKEAGAVRTIITTIK